MFNLFRKKNPLDKLKKDYARLLEDAFKLSKTNRTLSDAKHVEAEDVLKRIEAFKSE